MKIDILCSDSAHPINLWLVDWASKASKKHTVRIIKDKQYLRRGDILFLVSCTQLIRAEERENYRETMVLHASDLPIGRGWSPHIWAILGGATEITVSLLSAEDKVDSGAIWGKRTFSVDLSALYDEINEALFRAETELMSEGVAMVEANKMPFPQSGKAPTYLPRRQPQDSELDPKKTLVELFDQIRIADPKRYPAFFNLRGATYTLELKKVYSNESTDN